MEPALSAETPAPPGKTHWAVQALAGLGLLGIAGLIIILIAIAAISWPREYQPPKVAGNDRKVTFTVGNPGDLAGTGLTRMDIAASQFDGNSYSSRSGQDTRNILLVDRTSGESRKLLPDNSRHISRSHFLTAKGNAGEAGDDSLLVADAKSAPGPVIYYLLEIDRSSEQGGEDVLVGRLADRQQAYVMTGIDGIDRLWMRGPTQIGLIVRDHLKLYYRVVDVPTLKVVLSRPIAID